MVRSILAITGAVIIGLMVARFVERFGFAISATNQSEALASTYFAVLVLSWGVSALAATLVALIAGKRWAPLGYLAAATMTLNAIVTMLGAPPPWWVWPAGIVATIVGGYLPMRFTNASMVHPDKEQNDNGNLF